MTYSSFQASLFGEESTYLPEDSPVSHSLRQGNAEASTTNGICSPKLFELSEKFSPLGSFLKTLMASSAWRTQVGTLKWAAIPIPERRTSTVTKRYIHERKLCFSTVSVTLSKVKVTPSSRLLFQLVSSKVRHSVDLSVDEEAAKLAANANGVALGRLSGAPDYDTLIEAMKVERQAGQTKKAILQNIASRGLEPMTPPNIIPGVRVQVREFISRRKN